MDRASDIVASSPLPGLLFSNSGRLLASNTAWAEFAGAASDDWLRAIHPDDRAVAERLSRCGGLRHEFRVALGSGWRWVVASSFPCEEGQMVSCMEVGAEREDVLASLERERELNDLKNRFISVVSHEFRTPLTVILSSAELLEHYGSKWPDERRALHFHKIHTAVGTMTSLLDNVGLYGRAEAGGLECRPQAFLPGSMIAEIVEDANASLPPAQHVLFEDASGERPLESDPKLLRHAVVNLLSNAVRFSMQSGPVEVRCFWNADSWILEISDRGIGIPPEDAERVWERFQRGSNTDGIPGTGLGLPIVQRCAMLLGASAALLERPGGGVVARLETPRRPLRPEDALSGRAQ